MEAKIPEALDESTSWRYRRFYGLVSDLVQRAENQGNQWCSYNKKAVRLRTVE